MNEDYRKRNQHIVRHKGSDAGSQVATSVHSTQQATIRCSVRNRASARGETVYPRARRPQPGRDSYGNDLYPSCCVTGTCAGALPLRLSAGCKRLFSRRFGKQNAHKRRRWARGSQSPRSTLMRGAFRAPRTASIPARPIRTAPAATPEASSSGSRL